MRMDEKIMLRCGVLNLVCVFLLMLLSGCAGNMIEPPSMQASSQVKWIFKAPGGHDLNPQGPQDILACNLRPIYRNGYISFVYVNDGYVDVVCNTRGQTSWDLPCSVVRIYNKTGKVESQAVITTAAQYKNPAFRKGNTYYIETRQLTGDENVTADKWVRMNLDDGSVVNDESTLESPKDAEALWSCGSCLPKFAFKADPKVASVTNKVLFVDIGHGKEPVLTFNHEIKELMHKKISENEILIIADNYLICMRSAAACKK